MKFSAAGLVGNRFLLGVRREHWRQLDFSTLSRQLAIPQSLWLRVMQDMEQARAMFFAYEPDIGDGGTYRIYLEFMPAPEALRQHGVLPLGCGYKWHPEDESVAAVTAYRMRHLDSRAAFEGHLQAYLERLALPVLRGTRDVIARAAEAADPAGFMFLEVDEADTRRDSFTVTFRGAHLPLRDFIPDLLRLAGSLALPESEVLALLVPTSRAASTAWRPARRGTDMSSSLFTMTDLHRYTMRRRRWMTPAALAAMLGLTACARAPQQTEATPRRYRPTRACCAPIRWGRRSATTRCPRPAPAWTRWRPCRRRASTTRRSCPRRPRTGPTRCLPTTPPSCRRRRIP